MLETGRSPQAHTSPLGRGKLRGVKYSGVLATIAKAANMNASLNATNICAAAAAGDLLELRWYFCHMNSPNPIFSAPCSRGGVIVRLIDL